MILTISFMVLIGAIIGGMTNHFAIKMLFRPYNAKYIFGKRVPFTPGIIPKRRDELSVQLGDMVVKHLVTPEGIRGKLEEEEFKEKIKDWSKEEGKKILKSEKTLEEIIKQYAKIEDIESVLKDKVKEVIKKTYNNLVNEKGKQSLSTILPDNVHEIIESKIPMITNEITQKAIDYLNTFQGEQRLEAIMEQVLEERKMIKGFVNMFVGNEQLVDKVKTEIINIIKQKTTQDSLNDLLSHEWQKIKNKKISEYLKEFNQDEILRTIEEKALDRIPINSWLNKTINNWTKPYQQKAIEKWVPESVDKIGNVLIKKIDDILVQFDISNIVKKQVESFPVERLENLILGIVKKEFKMITYFGALLGGIIGLMQGMLIMFIG